MQTMERNLFTYITLERKKKRIYIQPLSMRYVYWCLFSKTFLFFSNFQRFHVPMETTFKVLNYLDMQPHLTQEIRMKDKCQLNTTDCTIQTAP